MVLDHSLGNGELTREAVTWPGSVRRRSHRDRSPRGQVASVLEQATPADLQSTERTRWPFRYRPFGDVVAWVNVKLTKNGAEIGYARFLYVVNAS